MKDFINEQFLENQRLFDEGLKKRLEAKELLDQNNYKDGEKILREAAEFYEKSGAVGAAVQVWLELNAFYMFQQDFQLAKKAVIKALQLIEKKLVDCGDSLEHEIAISYWRLCQIYESIDRPELAKEYFEKAATLYEKIAKHTAYGSEQCYFNLVVEIKAKLADLGSR